MTPRLLPALALAAATALPLSGCAGVAGVTGFMVDTPLGITADRLAVRPGQPLTGEVVFPDGTMTVTLAEVPVPRGRRIPDTWELTRAPQDLDAPGTVRCRYDDGDATYSCPTDDLAEGLYAVQVTDGDQPGEGTQSVLVAVTGVRGYAPQEGAGWEVLAAVGEPAQVALRGWSPGTTVRAEVYADGTRRLQRVRATVGPDGSGTLRLEPIAQGGAYQLRLSDGLWVTSVPLSVR